MLYRSVIKLGLLMHLLLNGGDDWNDVPYEHNAGEPYDYWYDDDGTKHDIDLVKVYYDLDYKYWNYLPCDNFTNSPYSVEDINKQRIPWISTRDFTIPAGTTLNKFISTIEQYKGCIFLKHEAKD